MAVSQESQMIIYGLNGFRKDGKVWEKGKEGYNFNTTAFFKWKFLFKKKYPHRCVHTTEQMKTRQVSGFFQHVMC